MKKTWFQIHWAIGISAGIVLAVVGVTGACLSFQNEILHWLNPGVITVAQRRSHRSCPPSSLRASTPLSRKSVSCRSLYIERATMRRG